MPVLGFNEIRNVALGKAVLGPDYPDAGNGYPIIADFLPELKAL